MAEAWTIHRPIESARHLAKLIDIFAKLIDPDTLVEIEADAYVA